MTQPASRQGFPPQRGDSGPADLSSGPPVIGADGPAPAGNRRGARSTLFGLQAGQVVVAQVGVALALAGVAGGPLWIAVTAPVALLLLVGAFGRFRRRWLYQWIGQGARYFGKRRSLPAGSTGSALLGLLRPAAAVTSIEVDSAQVGVVEDTYGLTAILEVGSTSGLLAEAQSPVPALGTLLPARSPDQPNVRLQLLLPGIAAPTASAGSPIVATSYRQLTEGRILAQQRVLLAVHVRRSGGFADDDLRRSLTSAVRRVRRRLDRAQLPCRALAGDSVLQAIADIAHHDGTGQLREGWSALETGGMRQVCFQLTRWPDPRGELSRVLLPRLLTLPGGSTTAALSVERSDHSTDTVNAELVIRIAAPSAEGLTASVNALRTLLGAAGAAGRPLDGAQLDALAATLPLGGGASGRSAVLSGVVARDEGIGQDGSGVPVSQAMLTALEVPVGGAGLVLGINRHGNPVTVRMFRPEPTRAALIGGLRCAELMALRALAVGARVIVQSGRPYAWEPFLRGISARGTSVVTMVAPGQIVEPPPASPIQPQLVVVDVGPVGATGIPVVESAWRTTLLVRDELGQTDLDVLARADLALLQPLTPNEAYVASAALGLGDSAGWLTRIRADMIGVVVGRRTLRWALLSTTPIEQQLIGAPTR
jgi:type VII secretion protein EccE